MNGPHTTGDVGIKGSGDLVCASSSLLRLTGRATDSLKAGRASVPCPRTVFARSLHWRHTQPPRPEPGDNKSVRTHGDFDAGTSPTRAIRTSATSAYEPLSDETVSGITCQARPELSSRCQGAAIQAGCSRGIACDRHRSLECHDSIAPADPNVWALAEPDVRLMGRAGRRGDVARAAAAGSVSRVVSRRPTSSIGARSVPQSLITTR